ncbi:MAG TPA: DUF177 domain-containing protein [Lachnospiraceae bacterium]
MQIDLTKLLSGEGRKESHDIGYNPEMYRSKMGDFPLEEAATIHFDLEHIKNRLVKVEARGEVSLWIPCGRCLQPVKVDFPIEVSEEIDLTLSFDERRNSEHSGNYIEGQVLDTNQCVDNEILIQWPLRVLCKDDCKGICSHCGSNRNITKCDCDTKELDPRMAAIKDIFHQFKEV